MSEQAKVVIIGGGFAGARVAQDLSKLGVGDVTLIDRKDYFEVTYAMLRGLAGSDDLAKRARLRYADFFKGTFVQAEVSSLAENAVTLADGTSVPFDYAVVASGSSYRTFPAAKSRDAVTLEAREQEFTSARAELAQSKNVLVVGGGAVGVELAGEIADHHPDKSVTLAERGSRLLGELTPKAGATAKRQLETLGVRVLLDTMLSAEDEQLKQADLVYQCVGLVPNTDIMQANYVSALDATGRIKVDATLRMTGTQNIFAIGDCADVPEGKMGYTADKQGAAAAKNVAAAINGKKLKSYRAGPMMALVPTGRKSGLVQLPFTVTTLGLMVNMKQKDMFISRQFGNLGVKR